MLSVGSHYSATCHPDCPACVDSSPAVLDFAAGNGKSFKYIYTFGSADFLLYFTKLTGVTLKAMLSSLLLCICDVVTQISAMSAQ